MWTCWYWACNFPNHFQPGGRLPMAFATCRHTWKQRLVLQYAGRRPASWLPNVALEFKDENERYVKLYELDWQWHQSSGQPFGGFFTVEDPHCHSEKGINVQAFTPIISKVGSKPSLERLIRHNETPPVCVLASSLKLIRVFETQRAASMCSRVNFQTVHRRS